MMTKILASPRIVVIGDLLLDTYLQGSCDRISPEAPVQIVDVTKTRRQLGGAGNVVGNLHALGAQATLISIVGDDAQAETLRQLLDKEGLDPRGLLVSPDRRTPEKTRIIAASQQVLRYDQETKEAALPGQEEEILARLATALSAGANAVILSDYGKGVLTRRVCQEAISLGHTHQIPVLCDPKGNDFTRYAGATVITPNRKEAAQATGVQIVDEASLERAGKALLTLCPVDSLLITLGKEGMALFEAEQPVRRIRTTAREVFDVSGAGDTVVAATAYALASGQDIDHACHFANAAAGVVVGKFGAARATQEEIGARFEPSLTRQSGRKVLDLESLEAILERQRSVGKRIAFTNGCFDLIHAGHVKFLEDAADLADLLVVGLNTDASIRRLKGASRPIQDSRDRAAILAALQSVDYVVLFDDDTPRELIDRLAPDILAKGQDYTVQTVVGAELVSARGGDVVLLPIMADRSTSSTIRKILEAHQ
ncbi:MAG: D-glycero-beta-D-manno-heptose-7-phosphate kinase [Deltaproteobacteria bacterium]|nr:D-glycero-beta-D-manno-heptose-7-phosphate kinase [Deltaproteobacteria bacterium]